MMAAYQVIKKNNRKNPEEKKKKLKYILDHYMKK